jgi:hypothetical protein
MVGSTACVSSRVPITGRIFALVQESLWINVCFVEERKSGKWLHPLGNTEPDQQEQA